MSKEFKMPLSAAQKVAEKFAAILAPVTTKLYVAGSIRRLQDNVSDIELVCIPAIARLEFGVKQNPNLLMRLIGEMADGGIVRPRRNVRGSNIAWMNEKESRYLAMLWENIPVDLFIVTPDRADQFGLIWWLRTGPAAANKMMVMAPPAGLKPKSFSMADGVAYKHGERVSAATEEEIFELLHLQYVPAPLRSVERYRRARRDWVLEKQREGER